MKRFKFVGSVYLVLIEDGKVLLQRRFNTGFADGQYGVPSGHMDGNETPREGCAREVQEEINIIIEPEDLRIVHSGYRRMEDERFDFYMMTDQYVGEIKNMEPHKCNDLSWFPLDDLPKNTVDYIRVALEHIKNETQYSEYDGS